MTPTMRVHYAEPELSFFLTQDSWDLKAEFMPNTIPSSTFYRGFVNILQGWLRDWSSRGHNIFIHPDLYPGGMPTCLEDAYMALAAYLSRTKETEALVFQIIENRVTSLRQQSVWFEGIETLDTRARLARTQALLVYTLIRVFDGCPRQRALAEDTFDTLSQWAAQMRDTALAEAPSIYEGLGGLRPGGDGRLEQALWQAWILSESVRRTWMLQSATLNLCQLQDGARTGCSGYLLFTIRQGLWEAPSAQRWVELVRDQNPLFAQSVDLLGLMEKTAPAEMDVFTSRILSVVLPAEQMDRWVARTTQGGRNTSRGCSAFT